MAVLDFSYDQALFPKHLRLVLERLTETSDKRECAQDWVGCFTTTAQIFRNGKTSNGREGKFISSESAQSQFLTQNQKSKK